MNTHIHTYTTTITLVACMVPRVNNTLNTQNAQHILYKYILIIDLNNPYNTLHIIIIFPYYI